MLNEWYKSGLAALYELSKKESGLELEKKDYNIENSLNLVIQNISEILNNILNPEQTEAYYYDVNKKKIRKYPLHEKLSNFSSVFLRQIISFKQEKQEIKKFSTKEQRFIYNFIEKNNLKENQIIRKKNNKEFVLISRRESIFDFIKRHLKAVSQKEDRLSSCIFCNHKGGLKVKGWFFPFIVDKAKFPNLYPEAKVESLKVCKNCCAILFAAYKNVFYFSTRDYLNFIFFYSDDVKILSNFLRRLREELSAEFGNPDYWRNFKTSGVNYPYEFLSEVLNKIATNPRYTLSQEQNQIGVAIFGAEIKGKKKIFRFGEKIDNIHILLQLLREIWEVSYNKKTEQRIDIFSRFTKSFFEYNPRTKKYNFKKKDGFIKRNEFLRDLFFFKRINWQLLEDVLFVCIKERGSTLPYNKLILSTIMRILNMPEKELYEKISKQGYIFGKRLIEVEGRREKVVKYTYDLRRARQLIDFLDQINNLQLRAEVPFDERSFRENENIFPKLKVYFLIGLVNAIFASREKRE